MINSLTPLANVESMFLQVILQSPYFQSTLWDRASGGTTPIVNKTKWESIAIPFSSYEEQKEIVKKVEKLFTICDQLEAQITSSQANAEKLMKAVLKEAFSQEEEVAI